jgi:hypothetical protein
MAGDLTMMIYNECIDTSSDKSSDDDDDDDDMIFLAAALVLHDNEQCDILPFRRSIKGHETLERDRITAHEQLCNDYFNPVGTLYTSIQFR